MIRRVAFSALCIAALVLSYTPAQARSGYCALSFYSKYEKQHLVHGKRSLLEKKTLRFMSYNFLNLIESVGVWVDHPSEPGRKIYVGGANAKDANLRARQGFALADIDADFIVGQEIEHDAIAEGFDVAHLNNRYDIYFEPGNDERGINVVDFVRSNLALEIEYRSSKHETWLDPTTGRVEPLFSRDLSISILRLPGIRTPPLIVFGYHGKSKRDRPGDRKSRLMAAEQFRRTRQIILNIKKEFGNDVGLIFLGDTNTNINVDPEIAPLFADNLLVDTLDYFNVPLAERVTHSFFPNNRAPEYAQIDLAAVSPNLLPYLTDAFVYRYKDGSGRELPLPNSFAEREKNPSDHYPVVFDLNIPDFLSDFIRRVSRRESFGKQK